MPMGGKYRKCLPQTSRLAGKGRLRFLAHRACGRAGKLAFSYSSCPWVAAVVQAFSQRRCLSGHCPPRVVGDRGSADQSTSFRGVCKLSFTLSLLTGSQGVCFLATCADDREVSNLSSADSAGGWQGVTAISLTSCLRVSQEAYARESCSTLALLCKLSGTTFAGRYVSGLRSGWGRVCSCYKSSSFYVCFADGADVSVFSRRLPKGGRRAPQVFWHIGSLVNVGVF